LVTSQSRDRGRGNPLTFTKTGRDNLGGTGTLKRTQGKGEERKNQFREDDLDKVDKV